MCSFSTRWGNNAQADLGLEHTSEQFVLTAVFPLAALVCCVQEPDEGTQYWVCGKAFESQIQAGKAQCHSVFGTCAIGLYLLVEM